MHNKIIHGREFDELIDQYAQAVDYNMSRYEDFVLLPKYQKGGWSGGRWHDDHSNPVFNAEQGRFVPTRQWIPRKKVCSRQVPSILVQVMPEIHRHGPLHLPPEQLKSPGKANKRELINSLDKLHITPRYGTVLAVSEHTPSVVRPGVDVAFSPQMGIQFFGDVQMFRTEKYTNFRNDLVRIFRLHPNVPEIIGVVNYNNKGKVVMVDFPGSEVSRRAHIIEESAIFRGHFVVETVDGEKHFVPKSWVKPLQSIAAQGA